MPTDYPLSLTLSDMRVQDQESKRRLDGALDNAVPSHAVLFQENSIMSTMSLHPNTAFPSMSSPLLGMWSDVTGVYGEAMASNTQQLMMSSVRVVQEQSMKRFAEANGKAAGMIGQGFVQAWVDGLRPVTRA